MKKSHRGLHSRASFTECRGTSPAVDSSPFSRYMIRSARALGGAPVVRHHDDRLAELDVQPVHQAEDVLGRLAVEVARRLVGDDQRRVGDDRARDRDALLLAARKLGGIVLHPVGEAPPARAPLRRARAGAPAPGRRVSSQRQLDVLERGQHRHQVVELENEADALGAPVGKLRFGELRDVDPVDEQLARVGLVDAGDQVEQRATCPSPRGPSAPGNRRAATSKVTSCSTGTICPPRR